MKRHSDTTGFWWHLYIPMLILMVVLLWPPVKMHFSEAGFRWLYILALSFGIAFCTTPVFDRLARRLDIVDRPDERKPHQRITPLLGGAAVFFGLIGAIALNGICIPVIARILAAAGMVFVIGIIDDAGHVSAGLKLAVQFAATVLVMTGGVVLHVLPVQLGLIAWAGNGVLTVLWIIGITNAMNFFDGMDGLAAGLGAMISFFLGVMALQTHQPFVGWIAVATMGGCLGFLPYNLKGKGQASIFLGDAGSTVIGFILACTAVYGEWAGGKPVVALVPPLLIFWVLIFDMVYITINRVITGKVVNVRQWLEYVGQDHLHHRLAQVIGSPRKSVLFIYMLSACLGISALAMRHAGPLEAFLLVVQAIILVGLISILEIYGRNCVS